MLFDDDDEEETFLLEKLVTGEQSKIQCLADQVI